MTTEALTERIQRIRNRLAEIEAERADLHEDNFDRRVELQDEEQTLVARLAELKDEAAGAMGQTDSEVAESTDYRPAPSLADDLKEVESAL